MIHLLLATFFPEWFWHPLGQCTAASSNHLIATHEIARCKSYNWYSGFAANFGELTLIGIAIGAWHHVNCHEHHCLRLSWQKDEEGHPVCKVHHKDHPAKSWFRSDKTHPRHARNKA